jgi:hypothetical protein
VTKKAKMNQEQKKLFDSFEKDVRILKKAIPRGICHLNAPAPAVPLQQARNTC